MIINGTLFIFCILGIFVLGVICGKIIPKINLVPRENKITRYHFDGKEWRPEK